MSFSFSRTLRRKFIQTEFPAILINKPFRCMSGLRKLAFCSMKNMIDPITLNVGGTKYETSGSTLLSYPDSNLCKMVDKQINLKSHSDNYCFIDRNGKYFDIILDYLRNGILNVPNTDRQYIVQHLLMEAQFYGIRPLINELKKMAIDSKILSTEQTKEIQENINNMNIEENNTKTDEYEWKLLYNKYDIQQQHGYALFERVNFIINKVAQWGLPLTIGHTNDPILIVLEKGEFGIHAIYMNPPHHHQYHEVSDKPISKGFVLQFKIDDTIQYDISSAHIKNFPFETVLEVNVIRDRNSHLNLIYGQGKINGVEVYRIQ